MPIHGIEPWILSYHLCEGLRVTRRTTWIGISGLFWTAFGTLKLTWPNGQLCSILNFREYIPRYRCTTLIAMFSSPATPGNQICWCDQYDSKEIVHLCILNSRTVLSKWDKNLRSMTASEEIFCEKVRPAQTTTTRMSPSLHPLPLVICPK